MLDEVEKQKKKESYSRLAMEVILRAFNDILSNEHYQYHTTRYLRNCDKNSKNLLKKHHNAIEWFIGDRDNIWFDYLGISLRQKQIVEAICNKFNSLSKFNKYYSSPAGKGVERDT